MIEHEFLFLGLLAGGSKHGYEIKRQIDEDLKPNLGLNINSIYYPLKQMEKDGLIAKSVGRQGRWPEKQVYSITTKGRKKFDELMAERFLTIERPFFQIDLSLYFLPYVQKASAKRRLKARLGLLSRICRDLIPIKDKAKLMGSPHYMILQHNFLLVQAEIASLKEIIEQL